MADKTNPDQESTQRRKSIKKIGVAGGLAATGTLFPKTWIKPIVESVVLPAHGQTSCTNVCNGLGCMPPVDIEVLGDTSGSTVNVEVGGPSVSGTGTIDDNFNFSVPISGTPPGCNIVGLVNGTFAEEDPDQYSGTISFRITCNGVPCEGSGSFLSIDEGGGPGDDDDGLPSGIYTPQFEGSNGSISCCGGIPGFLIEIPSENLGRTTRGRAAAGWPWSWD